MDSINIQGLKSAKAKKPEKEEEETDEKTKRKSKRRDEEEEEEEDEDDDEEEKKNYLGKKRKRNLKKKFTEMDFVKLPVSSENQNLNDNNHDSSNKKDKSNIDIRITFPKTFPQLTWRIFRVMMLWILAIIFISIYLGGMSEGAFTRSPISRSIMILISVLFLMNVINIFCH
jgi:hypothetical protein